MFTNLSSKMCRVVVELKNNLILEGNINSIDKNLNIILSNISVDSNYEYIFKSSKDLFIRGNNVKFISIKKKDIDFKSLKEETINIWKSKKN